MGNRLVITIFFASAITACASGDLAPGGPGLTSGDAAVAAPAPEGGTASDASPDSTAPSVGAEAGPGVFDGGPPAVIGSQADAASDAPSDAPVDAKVCGPPSASSSYAASCSGVDGGASCSITGNTLVCVCKNNAQTPVSTSLDMCTCTQPPVIANSNGVLTCP